MVFDTAVFGWLWDWQNEVFVQPRFLFDGELLEEVFGEIFIRVDAAPGDHTIEMVTEDFTFDNWGVWPEAENNPVFTDILINPTIISIPSGVNISSLFFCTVHPSADPFETVFVETYRGVDIYQYVLSGWYTFTYDEIIYAQPPPLEDVRARIDTLIEEAGEPEFIETYRGVDIYWLPTLEVFKATVAPGYIAVAPTLDEIYPLIDEILAFLEDPDPDPTSILNQIMAQVMIWIDLNLAGWLQPLRDWVSGGFALAQEAWESLVADAVTLIAEVGGALALLGEEVRDRWDTFNTVILPGIGDAIAAVLVDVTAALDSFRVDIAAFITDELVVFATWVEGLLADLDPLGFLPDPDGYIATVFNTLISPWIEDIVESFWVGLEEGLEDG